MSKRIDLGLGQFADVKEVSELNHGDHKSVKAAVDIVVDEFGNRHFPGDMDERMIDALAARIILAWNLQYSLPSTNSKVLDELTPTQARALKEGLKEHIEAINAENDPTKQGTDPTAGSAI